MNFKGKIPLSVVVPYLNKQATQNYFNLSDNATERLEDYLDSLDEVTIDKLNDIVSNWEE